MRLSFAFELTRYKRASSFPAAIPFHGSTASPYSVFNEFSAAVDSGDRTAIQAVSAIVEGPQAAGGIRLIDPRVE